MLNNKLYLQRSSINNKTVKRQKELHIIYTYRYYYNTVYLSTLMTYLLGINYFFWYRMFYCTIILFHIIIVLDVINLKCNTEVLYNYVNLGSCTVHGLNS